MNKSSQYNQQQTEPKQWKCLKLRNNTKTCGCKLAVIAASVSENKYKEIVGFMLERFL